VASPGVAQKPGHWSEQQTAGEVAVLSSYGAKTRSMPLSNVRVIYASIGGHSSLSAAGCCCCCNRRSRPSVGRTTAEPTDGRMEQPGVRRKQTRDESIAGCRLPATVTAAAAAAAGRWWGIRPSCRGPHQWRRRGRSYRGQPVGDRGVARRMHGIRVTCFVIPHAPQH
jgi:hypothetical protein